MDLNFYRPQTKFAKVMFLQVSVCPQGGHVWWWGGHAWWWGGMWWGACMVGGACMVVGGCVWWRGMHGGGGMCGGGGVCVVAEGHAWWGHAWWQGGCMGYDEILSMSRRYASYWNAFLYYLVSVAGSVIQYLHILLWFTSLSSR